MYTLRVEVKGCSKNKDDIPFTNVIKGRTVRPLIMFCISLEECKKNTLEYIKENKIEKNNYILGAIYKNNEVVASIDYNGNIRKQKGAKDVRNA